MTAPTDPSSLPLAPPPWTCKCIAYVLPFHTSSPTPMPHEKVLAPLEAASKEWTSEAETGKHTGGWGYVQIIRYSDTPVGPYDELCIIPGAFQAPETVGCKGNHLRITGIWVSQEATLLNGRRSWNIPKHLAKFKFTPTSSAPLPLRVEVSALESDKPFFTTTIHPTSYTPTFPFNSSWQGYLGLPNKCLQPPLPTGSPPEVEVGSDDWKLLSPIIKSKKTRIVWLDMEQGENREGAHGDGARNAASSRSKDNWWPGMGRWRLGMSCDEAVLELGHPEIFKSGPQ